MSSGVTCQRIAVSATVRKERGGAGLRKGDHRASPPGSRRRVPRDRRAAGFRVRAPRTSNRRAKRPGAWRTRSG
jgi:hypothetical protein